MAIHYLQRNDFCSNCQEPSLEEYRCNTCQVASYCSEICLWLDGVKHRKVCHNNIATLLKAQEIKCQILYNKLVLAISNMVNFSRYSRKDFENLELRSLMLEKAILELEANTYKALLLVKPF